MWWRLSSRTISRCESGQRLRDDYWEQILGALHVTSVELERIIDPYLLIETSAAEFQHQVRTTIAAVQLRDAFDLLQTLLQFWERAEARRFLPEDARRDATP